jgi:hypothetical protein
MPAPLAIMLHGGLASVLHDLLEDSIDALLDDAIVQRPLLTLLEALCAHLSVIPVLTAKGSWPTHLLPDRDQAAGDTAGPSGVHRTSPLYERLRYKSERHKQCHPLNFSLLYYSTEMLYSVALIRITVT